MRCLVFYEIYKVQQPFPDNSLPASKKPSEIAQKTYGDLSGDIINIIGHWTHPAPHVKKRLIN